jgi:hypothetical protein
MSEEMKLSELCQMADEQQQRKQHEAMEALWDDPFERGYAAGYARAQQDIRMALGCKA